MVLKFRPRTSAQPPGGREEPDPARTPSTKASNKTPNTGTSPAANDLSRYERPRDEGDDFRHRMLANIAALAFTVAFGSGQRLRAVSSVPAAVNKLALVTVAIAGKFRRVAS